MTESTSLNALFSKGMTREEFIAKYSEMTKDKDGTPSVFLKNMENTVSVMFDTLNSNGNDTIDEDELKSFMGADGNVEDISEADLEVLYQKMADKINKSYSTDDPEKMYNLANQNKDVSESTYIRDLSDQIEVLNELIALRTTNSTNITTTLQSQIDDIILKSTSLSTDFKVKYKETSAKLEKLKRESAKNTTAMQAKEQEIEDTQREIAIIQKEIQNDEENPNDEKKKELSTLSNYLDNLTDEYKGLTSKNTNFAKQIKDTTSELSKLTKDAQSVDANSKERIETLNARIGIENSSCNSDIASYKAQIQKLQNAQGYAITRLPKPAGKVQETDNSSYHKNDNKLDLKDVNYSSEKGEKLAKAIKNNAVGFTGYCSRYVSNALASSGLGNERASSAHLMDDKLRSNKNFKEVTINSQEDLKNLPAGCVVVYEAGAGGYNAKHGHIEVTLGDGTAGSDGITRNMRYAKNMSVFVPVEA